MKRFNNKIILIFLIVISFFGTFVIMNYSVDTYLLLASPKLSYVKEYFNAGRIITGLFFSIQGIIHIPPYLMYLSSFIMAITFTTITIYTLKKILDKYISNEILSLIASIAIIINPFVIELWLFIETGIMMLSVLSCVMAFKYFDEFLELKNNKKIYKSLLWMFIALLSYQGTVALFIGLSLISILKYSKTIKEFIKNNFIMGLIYLIPTIVNYLFVIVMSRERVGSNHNLVKVFNFIISSTKSVLINGFGLLPKGLFPLIICVSIIISIYYCLSSKKKIINILSLIYVIVVIYLFTIAPIIPQNSNELLIFPRTTYAFGSIVGILFILINNKSNYKLLISILVIILGVEFYSFKVIEINRYIVNYNDKQVINKINDKINNYEEETGNKVKYISLYNQDNSHLFDNEIRDNINVTARAQHPNCEALFIYYTNRKIEKKSSNNNIYIKYFKNKHWKYFDLDQVIIIDDTIHWYLY